jgi:IS30 family transposase
MEDPRTHDYVYERLLKRWSPDQIAAVSRREFWRHREQSLSRQTIYNWIAARARDWRMLLRRRGRAKEERGKLNDCVRIDGRPDVINRRCRYGDWEGDTVVSPYRRSGMLTLVERKSGLTRLGLVNSLHSSTTIQMAARRLQELPACLRRSVTFDNGKEFAQHRDLASGLGVAVYFAAPYRSWQRGTNENTNGLLRQFFPKGTDFARISHREVARVECLLNERPRRRLGYRTPLEVLAKKLRCN